MICKMLLYCCCIVFLSRHCVLKPVCDACSVQYTMLEKQPHCCIVLLTTHCSLVHGVDVLLIYMMIIPAKCMGCVQAHMCVSVCSIRVYVMLLNGSIECPIFYFVSVSFFVILHIFLSDFIFSFCCI
jgi:hypothetical protein